eukprot:jgi/Botrbrau1/13983/Bobra.117_2s0013.1
MCYAARRHCQQRRLGREPPRLGKNAEPVVSPGGKDDFMPPASSPRHTIAALTVPLGLKAKEAGEEDEGVIRLEAEKAERARIEERTTLRHRNTSRWSKRILRRGALAIDEGSKAAIEEQLRMHQELRRKLAPQEGEESDEDGEASSGNSSEGEEAAGQKPARNAKAVEQLRSLLEQGEGEGEGEKPKGLLGLPFMRRAAERQRQEAQESHPPDGAGT